MRVVDGSGVNGVDGQPGQEGQRLFTFQGVQDAKAGTEFKIGNEVFAHTDPTAVVRLEATTSTGDPLPSWLTFDPATGTFRGTPPVGDAAVQEIVVIARDTQGREASASFTLQMGLPAAGNDLAVPPQGSSGASPAPSQGAGLDTGASENASPDKLEPGSGAVLPISPDQGSTSGTRVGGGQAGLTGPSIAIDADGGKQISTASVGVDRSVVQGFQVLRVTESEASKVSTSADIQGDAHRLFVHGGLKEARGDKEFVIPQDLFAHTDSNAVVRLEAQMADGSSLPSWLSFDSQTGAFKGVSPDGRAILDLVITAHDDSGREATLSITLELGVPADGDGKSGERSPDSGQDTGDANSDDFASRRVAADDDTADSVDAAGANPGAVGDGKLPVKRSALPFSEQIKAAKTTRDPVLAKIIGDGNGPGSQRPT